MNTCCEAKVQQLYTTIELKEKELKDAHEHYRAKVKFQQERIGHLERESWNLKRHPITVCGHDSWSIHVLESDNRSLKRQLAEIEAEKSPTWLIVLVCILGGLNLIQFYL